MVNRSSRVTVCHAVLSAGAALSIVDAGAVVIAVTVALTARITRHPGGMNASLIIRSG
jgi:hypothetical protein